VRPNIARLRVFRRLIWPSAWPVLHGLNVDLQAAITRFLKEHNQQSKPFTWTADPDKIIAAVKRGHQVLNSFC
jgi:hypothetical protein